ncbi:hypothetical protein HAT2_00431 [Candidatus Similichlamydia laticola]|uniref:Uncharacterized protein n=1 Tax=Candidatus Similichlamydia laticola TaxID=2170265 RepID=A0A369KI67_9BACT|nr:hypothetical protein HAT2_00431 [Candidatus Similichlamydia laticola]
MFVCSSHCKPVPDAVKVQRDKPLFFQCFMGDIECLLKMQNAT